MSTQAVGLTISLHGLELLKFDVLEVWRSRDTANGPYEPLTDAGSKPARMPADAPDPPAIPQTGPLLNCVGNDFLLRSHKNDFIITAAGTDPLTYAMLAIEVGTQTLGAITAYVVDGAFVLQTLEVGGHAKLVVAGGDLAGQLSLPINKPAFGREPYIPLVAGQVDYAFVDQQGSSSYWYKWRLRSTLLDEVSEFGAPFHPQQPRVTDTIIGYVDLTDMDGSALEAREVRLYSRFNGQLSNGRVVAGFSKNALTDKSGHVEFALVRGQPITAAIAGTNLVRDLIVPTDPTVERFNLLDPSLGTNDVFKVQVPDIPYATRRSF